MSVTVYDEARVIVNEKVTFRHSKNTDTVKATIKELALALRTKEGVTQELEVVSAVRKTPDSDDKRYWNLKEAQVLLSLEQAGVTCVPRLLDIGEDGSITTDYIRGIEGDNFSIMMYMNEYTSCAIALMYIYAMKEVYEAGFLNFDQIIHNFGLELDADGRPQNAYLFDLTAEAVFDGKIILNPSDYRNRFHVPPEVVANQAEHEHTYRAEPMLVYTVCKCLDLFWSHHLPWKEKGTKTDDRFELVQRGLADNPEERPTIDEIVRGIEEIQLAAKDRGEQLAPIVLKEHMQRFVPRKRLIAAGEGIITQEALSELERALLSGEKQKVRGLAPVLMAVPQN